MMSHAFCLRFRKDVPEESEKVLIACETFDGHIKTDIQSVFDQVISEFPSAQFEGMVYHARPKRLEK